MISGKFLEGWQFNVDGALPLHTGLEILADGPHGPVIFQFQEYSLHIGCSVTNHRISEPIKQLIRNYYSHLFQLIGSRNTLGLSCYHFIYVQHQGDISESSKISSRPAPPLTNISIKSKLKNGPKLILSPVTEIHETPDLPVPVPDLSHIIGPPKLGTTRVFRQQYRDPYRMKHLRLQQVFETCYGENKIKELREVSLQIQNKIQLENEQREEGKAPRTRSRSPSPSSPSRPTSPPRMEPSSSVADNNLQNRCSTTAGRYYEASNRALIAEEKYRRCQTTSRSSHHQQGPPPTRPMRSQNPANRINWMSDWRNVRGSDGEAVTNEDGDQRDQRKTSLEEEAKLSFLPLTHPLSRPSTTLGLPGASSTSVYQSTNPRPSPPVVTTRILRPQTAGSGGGKPYCGYREHEKKIQEIERMEYESVFRGGYLTPYEKERKEYSDQRKKFLNGTFKTYSGKASEVPLRSDGGVQAHGPYPAPIQSNKEMTKVGQYGPWKPTSDLYSNHRDKTFEAISRSQSRNKLQSR